MEDWDADAQEWGVRTRLVYCWGKYRLWKVEVVGVKELEIKAVQFVRGGVEAIKQLGKVVDFSEKFEYCRVSVPPKADDGSSGMVVKMFYGDWLVSEGRDGMWRERQFVMKDADFNRAYNEV